MTVHIVVDLETLGTDPGKSVVIDLAATSFSLDQVDSFQDIISDKSRNFYSKLSVEDQIRLGREIDPVTLDWWSEQDARAIERLAPSKDDVTLERFCQDFKDWLDAIPGYDQKTAIFYCRGQSFDFPFIASLVKNTEEFQKENNPAFWPCSFWNQRDIRTVLAVLWGDISMTKGLISKAEQELFVAHNSVHDNAKAIISMQVLWNATEINLDDYTTE